MQKIASEIQGNMKNANVATSKRQLILHYGLQPCSELSSRWFDYPCNSNALIDKNQLGVGMRVLSHLKIEVSQGCPNSAMLADDFSRTDTKELGLGSNTSKSQEPQSFLANHKKPNNDCGPQSKTKLHPDPRSGSICQAHPDLGSGWSLILASAPQSLLGFL